MTSLPFLQPLTKWRPLPVLKTSAVLERRRAGGLPEGGVTVQLQAQNERHMMSDIVSQSVVVGDNKPILTGETTFPALTTRLPFFFFSLSLFNLILKALVENIEHFTVQNTQIKTKTRLLG